MFLHQAEYFGNVTFRRDIEKLRGNEIPLERGAKVASLLGKIEIIPLAVGDPKRRRAGMRMHEWRGVPFAAWIDGDEAVEVAYVVDAAHGDDTCNRLAVQLEF